MATYKTSFGTVSYAGWQGKWGVISPYSTIKWGITLTADIIYKNKKRYLHITKAVLRASFYINSKIQVSAQKWVEGGMVCSGNMCIWVDGHWVTQTYWTWEDFNGRYPSGQPGSASVTLKARYPNTIIGGTGVTGNYTISGFNLGGFLSTCVNRAQQGAQSGENSSTVNCNIEMELPNDACSVAAWMKSTTGEYRDWGQLWVTPTFGLYVPNTPGVQYYTGSKWETHRIKRWNGSAWVNIPGKRYGSGWDEVQG